ncbi:MAG: argininosuccinate lyase [Sandaracinaceae bacterium]|nr:argininosuccinate lyase [Sandaracinaceae bacterium]
MSKKRQQSPHPVWGGRFEEKPEELAQRFSSSVEIDKRMWREDIRASVAHSRMLGAQGIIDAKDVAAIEAGLEEIAKEIEENQFEWKTEYEDVHMNIEARLIEKVGEAGKRLHTARSRNDQVATDIRLWTRQALGRVIEQSDRLIAVICARAAEEVDTLMPGYTHLQRAQPIRLALHLLAWCEMLERDRGRYHDTIVRLNECPLGAAALAGTSFPIDREATARELGFRQPTRNSIDAVSDRDFLLESLAALAIQAVHLSRMAEELVLWSTQEFGFVEMADRFATGSSIMPQKKNPDMAELIRGKAGRVIGDLVNLLVVMKGLPLAYNRDMQEDKFPIFDAFDTVEQSLAIMRGMVATLVFRRERMRKALDEGFIEATEIADWLTRRGVPFRESHQIVGKIVRFAMAQGKKLSDLSLDEFKEFSPLFDASIYEIMLPERVVELKQSLGGTAKEQVLALLSDFHSRLLDRGIQPEEVLRAERKQE